MLSKKAKYGLKALTLLARRYGEGPVLITELAQEEKIPKKFLELILLTLKNKGILQSRKGKGGGYILGRPPDSISLGEVIRALDGPLALLPCVSQTAYQKCDECKSEATCGIRMVMREVRYQTVKILDGTSIADLLRNVEMLESVPKEKAGVLMYHI